MYSPEGEKIALLTDKVLKCSPRRAPLGSVGSNDVDSEDELRLLPLLGPPNLRRSQNFTVRSRPAVARQYPSRCKLQTRIQLEIRRS